MNAVSSSETLKGMPISVRIADGAFEKGSCAGEHAVWLMMIVMMHQNKKLARTQEGGGPRVTIR